ncbi:MAG TPA: sn-glycerol-3-phosphate ABC transporter ATP-binding protein UgpC [Elusimicrobiales bacterium]|nr:sn-glycerol-3-phosphate ABC transporter ATP-binding protein UgpC [Elusimicrobiales bacterium]
MASVSFKDITKSFKDTPVLKGVSLDIEDHEFMVIVGPSGCGKTTLLRMLAGLEEVSSGEITIGGARVDGLPPSRREIAMVFQDYALYPHMTVEENMSFSLRLRKFPPAEIASRVAEAAGILQLGDLLKRMPRQLSGGQRQRVAIGRAIVRKPKVFLFDEPLSNLDAKLREEMRVEISKLYRRLNATILYVTHDQVEAMTLATRIAVMDRGVIQQVGAPMEVYRRPRNMFVAGFIGSPAMNLLPGRLSVSGGGVVFGNGSMELALPRGLLPEQEARDGREVVLGVRPENVAVESPAGDGLSDELKGELEARELLGHRENLYIKAGGTRLLAAIDRFFDRAPGSAVGLRLNYRDMHVFDKAGGVRLSA